MKKREIRKLYIQALRNSGSVKGFLEAYSQVAEFYDNENEEKVISVICEVDKVLASLEEW